MCSLNVRQESSVTPKSFSKGTGVISFPRNCIGGTSTFARACLEPNNKNLILSGFISRLLEQQQAATLFKSASIFPMDSLRSLIAKDKLSLESFTYESISQLEQMLLISLMYRLKSRGPNMDPCGTPWVILFYSDQHSPIRTNIYRSVR